MQTPDESNSPACRRSSLLFALPAAVIFAQAAPAGIGIVNANQHRTVEAANCPPTPSQCPQSTTLPLDDLGDYYLIGANSFHVKDEEGCQFAQARCFYDDRNKAKILSSDPPWSPLGCGAALDPEVVQPWITATTNETQHPRGTIHFEHFDACLSYKAQRGEEIISDFDSFPNIADCHGFDPELFPNPEYEVSPQAMLIWIAQPARTSLSATRLLQNGWLHRTGPVLKWQAPDPDCSPSPCFVDEPKRLIGMGFMGALTAESHLVIPDYVRTLRNYNVNFTRIWSVEQWCGLAGGLLGLTPFAGQWGNDTYNLDGDKPAFYHRLRRFAQEAADRGIVLQLSLFDKHGLVCNSQAARWLDSPYRAARNNKAWLANTILNCTCGCGVSCHPLTEFIENAELGAIHKRYLRRVAEEVGGIGNVMFEIINEALAPEDEDRPGDWPENAPPPSTTSKNQQWQEDMAYALKLGTPLENSIPTKRNIVRDAFNGDAAGTSLTGKISDISGAPWTAVTNAKILLTTTDTGNPDTLGPPRTLGYATSRGIASSMSASLPFATTSTWTKLHVRADLTTPSPGQLRIGVVNNCGAALHVEVDSSGDGQIVLDQAPCTAQPSLPPLGEAPLPNPFSKHNVRLKIVKDTNPAIWKASVFLDGAPVAGLQNISAASLGSTSGVYFAGWNGSPTYPPDAGRVDNFEAARFCDDESVPACVPGTMEDVE